MALSAAADQAVFQVSKREFQRTWIRGRGTRGLARLRASRGFPYTPSVSTPF